MAGRILGVAAGREQQIVRPRRAGYKLNIAANSRPTSGKDEP